MAWQRPHAGPGLLVCCLAEGSPQAQAVVEAAGGVVITTDGARLSYNTKAELLNPHFLVFGDPTRDWLRVIS